MDNAPPARSRAPVGLSQRPQWHALQQHAQLAASRHLRELFAQVPEARFGYPEVRRGLVSCTGTDFCNLALIDTKTRAMALAKEFEKHVGKTRPISVRWSGCPASCANHHTADIGLQGCKVRADGKIVDGVVLQGADAKVTVDGQNVTVAFDKLPIDNAGDPPAPVATGADKVSVNSAALARPADSVMFCLSKGLGTPATPFGPPS